MRGASAGHGIPIFSFPGQLASWNLNRMGPLLGKGVWQALSPAWCVPACAHVCMRAREAALGGCQHPARCCCLHALAARQRAPCGSQHSCATGATTPHAALRLALVLCCMPRPSGAHAAGIGLCWWQRPFMQPRSEQACALLRRWCQHDGGAASSSSCTSTTMVVLPAAAAAPNGHRPWGQSSLAGSVHASAAQCSIIDRYGWAVMSTCGARPCAVLVLRSAVITAQIDAILPTAPSRTDANTLAWGRARTRAGAANACGRCVRCAPREHTARSAARSSSSSSAAQCPKGCAPRTLARSSSPPRAHPRRGCKARRQCRACGCMVGQGGAQGVAAAHRPRRAVGPAWAQLMPLPTAAGTRMDSGVRGASCLVKRRRARALMRATATLLCLCCAFAFEEANASTTGGSSTHDSAHRHATCPPRCRAAMQPRVHAHHHHQHAACAAAPSPQPPA